jgi:multicomponent Na+:H+ antiporter subunit D
MASTYSSEKVDYSAAMNLEPVAAADWLIVAPVLVSLIGGAVCLMMRKNTDAQPKLAMIFLALLVLVNFGLLIRVLDQGVITMVMGGWLPPFGIAFTVDALGATLSLIASIVAFCAGLYGIATVGLRGADTGFIRFLSCSWPGCAARF